MTITILLKELIVLLMAQSVILRNKIAKINTHAYNNIFFKKNGGGHCPPNPTIASSLMRLI